jgi:hypothetical protein
MTIPATTAPGTSSQVVAEVKQQLRELNQETHPVRVALNQAQSCLNRAVKLMEETSHRKRQAIIAATDENEE